MKTRIESAIWTDLATKQKTRRWHVLFEDSCGCYEETDFPTFATAARFAHHVATGGSRWEFVA